MRNRPVWFLMVLGAFLFSSGWASSGDEAKSGGGMPYPLKENPEVGEIYHLPTGTILPFEGAMDMISGARLICVGETHDNMGAHRVELMILRELYRRFPGGVALGMEMFREPDQEVLDRWTKGELSEIEFLRATKWYENWGADFGYYRDILLFARENRIDIVALNPPKELQEEVRDSGLDNVPERFRASLPKIGEPDPYQRAAMKAVYGAHLQSEGMFDTFFRIQLLWEETMALRVVEYLRSPGGEGKKLVTLTGGWHVKYGFGIPKKVIRRMPVPYAIVLPEEITIPEEKKGQVMDVDLPSIPLLPGDFLWVVRYEGLEGKQAVMGVRLSAKDNEVLVEGVLPASPAEKAGILSGDRILYFDGQRVLDVTDLVLRVRGKKQGDEATVVVRRGGVEKPLRVRFSPIEMPHGE